MFRRSLPALMGAPPKKRAKNPPVLHLSQRPAAPAQIDFTKLGLTYPVTNSSPGFSISGINWAPKPEKTRSDLPFAVDRSGPASNFAVYSQLKGGGRTKVVTVVKKIKGDALEFQKELQKVVDGSEIEIRPGKLVVRGNYVKRVKLWLLAMGF